jgi:hypothetical protein
LKFDATVVADSVSPSGIRLTTMLLTYPRFVHAELMTHRVFSRNAASSRAIPVHKKIKRIKDFPVVPIEWGKNKPGMQASELLTPQDEMSARWIWHWARMAALTAAEALDKLKVHKQIANRVLEPFDWMVTLVSSTYWRNFDVLRKHKDADPHMQKIATMRLEAYNASTPKELKVGEWHLPFIKDGEFGEDIEYAKKVSAGRCARLSYLTHDGRRDPSEDVELFKRLTVRDGQPEEPGHWTPVEHQATPIGGFTIQDASGLDQENWFCQWCHGGITKKLIYFNQVGLVCFHCAQGHIMSGNFLGWTQFRKTFQNENFDA